MMLKLPWLIIFATRSRVPCMANLSCLCKIVLNYLFQLYCSSFWLTASKNPRLNVTWGQWQVLFILLIEALSQARNIEGRAGVGKQPLPKSLLHVGRILLRPLTRSSYNFQTMLLPSTSPLLFCVMRKRALVLCTMYFIKGNVVPEAKCRVASLPRVKA